MANEPRNLYSLEEQFKLIIDGVTHLIDEPIGWSNISILGSRDKVALGLLYEFTDENTSFIFERGEGFEILEDEYNKYAGDAKADFEFGYIQNGKFIKQYAGAVNFNTRHLTSDGVEFTIEKTYFEGKLRTRSETKVDFSSLLDYDKNPIVPPDQIEISLHSKKIVKLAEAEEKLDFVNGIPGIPDDTYYLFHQTLVGTKGWIQPDSTNISATELDEMFGLPLAGADAAPESDDRFQFEAMEDSLAKLTFYVKMDCMLKTPANPGLRQIKLSASIKVQRRGTIIHTANINPYNANTPSKQHVFSLEFSMSTFTYLEIGDRVYFAILIECPQIDPGGVFNIYLTKYKNKMTISGETYAPPSTCKGYRILDCMNHTVASITGMKNRVVSDFFGVGGPGYKWMLCNGFMLRNFSLENKPFSTSWDELYKGVEPIWFIGLNYIKDANGDTLIQAEPAYKFFGTKRIYDIKEIFGYEELHSKEATFNEMEFGFAKYSEEEINTLDDFSTYRKDLTPITSYKNMYSKKSSFIASGWLIEKARRDQFNKTPSTSLPNDDAVFIIAYSDDRIYKNVGWNFEVNKVNFNRRLDLKKGDTFKIDGGTLYTVLAKDLSGFDSYIISPIAGVSAGIGTVEITVTGKVAERDEAFEIVENLGSPETAYNLRITLKRMMYNHSPMINSCLAFKPDTDVIQNTEFKSNGTLKTKLWDTDPYILTVNNYTLQENEDVILGQLNDRRKLFIPVTVNFKTRMRFDNFIKIRDSLIGQTGIPENDFGIISHPDNKGNVWESVIWSFEYKPKAQELTLQVRKLKKIA